jgi:hypothetical protein
MSLKAKLDRLEARLGLERCPHCGGVVPPRAEEEGISHELLPDEERRRIVCRSLAALFNREQLLELLESLPPCRGVDLADLYSRRLDRD